MSTTKYLTHNSDPAGSIVPHPQTEDVLPMERRFVSIGFTKTVFGFLIASASLFGLAGITTLSFWGLLGAFSVTDDELFDAAATSDLFVGLAYLSMFVSAILVIVWFNLAYKAAKSRGATGMKWGSGWTVGSWVTPFLWFWVPKQIMNDIDRISQAELVEPVNEDWKGRTRLAVSDWWWGTWIAATVMSVGTDSVFEESIYGVDPSYFLASAGSYALLTAAGALLAVTVLTIGKRLQP